jgi:hypothetical protein
MYVYHKWLIFKLNIKVKSFALVKSYSILLLQNHLLSKAWESYEADKRIEGFSPQTLKDSPLQAMLLIRFFNDLNIEH